MSMVHGQGLQWVLGKVTRAAGSVDLAPISATGSLQHPWPIHLVCTGGYKTSPFNSKSLKEAPCLFPGSTPVPSNPCRHWETGSRNWLGAEGERDGWRRSNLKAFFLSLGKEKSSSLSSQRSFSYLSFSKGDFILMVC